LVNNTSRQEAMRVRALIAPYYLGEVAEFAVMYGAEEIGVRVNLRRSVIDEFMLELTREKVASRIEKTKALRGVMSSCVVDLEQFGGDEFGVFINRDEATADNLDVLLTQLKIKLPEVQVSGLKDVNRVTIDCDEKGVHTLTVDSSNFFEICGVDGVRGTEVQSNDIHAIRSCLGVEAARRVIMNEVRTTYANHSLSIDPRHLSIVADAMTFTGQLNGLTRQGVSQYKQSVLMNASFENTAQHLEDAAVHGRMDRLRGVSERILMGLPVPVGTGVVELRVPAKLIDPFHRIETVPRVSTLTDLLSDLKRDVVTV